MELLKNIANSLGFRFELDVLALYEIVMLDHIVSRRTLYKNVSRLLSGEYINIRLDGKFFSYRIDKYWDITQLDEKPTKHKEPIASLVKTLISLLNKFCKEVQGSLVVPISGGIDSSLLLFLATKAEDCKHVQAVHVNLGSKIEQLLSKIVATKARASLHIKVFSEQWLRDNYFELLKKMLKVIGYPREGDAALPYLILAQTNKSLFNNKTVSSVGGEGSDPVFGGGDYYKYYATQLLLERRISMFLELVRTLRKYNYERENFTLILLKPLQQLVLRFYRLRYQYFKLKSRKLLAKKSKQLINLVAQYLAQLSNVLYNIPVRNYYHKSVTRMFIHKISHVIHTRVRAEDSQGNIIFLPFASRPIPLMNT